MSKKQKLSSEFKARVFELKDEGLTAKQAMAKAAQEHKLTVQTSWNEHTYSILHGWKQSLKKSAKLKIAKGPDGLWRSEDGMVFQQVTVTLSVDAAPEKTGTDS
tara:strand:- start:979 stop:1290 length:312 start_codon:yes stop_codon:yes gene_type:complete